MISQGYPVYTLGFQNLGYIFGRLFLHSTNINENTQGNPGLPWVRDEIQMKPESANKK